MTGRQKLLDEIAKEEARLAGLKAEVEASSSRPANLHKQLDAAAPQRRDGHHPILPMQLGPVRFRVDAKSQAAKRPFDHKLVVRQTGFSTVGLSEGAGIQEIYAALALHGGMKPKERREVVARLDEIPDGEERLLIATGRYIGEGFDDARLDTLFMIMEDIAMDNARNCRFL